MTGPEIRRLRTRLGAARPGEMTLQELLSAFGGLRTALAGSTRTGKPPAVAAQVAHADRPKAFAAACAAVDARARGALEEAAFACVNALALEPLAEYPARVLAQVVAELSGKPYRQASAPQPDAALEGARTFVVAADADELLADPSLLDAYGACFDQRDDVTLAVRYAGRIEELAAAVERSQAGRADGPDLLAVPAAADPVARLRFTRGVHAVLSEQEQQRDLAPRPRFGAAEIASLRRLASAPRPEPLSVAITICAGRRIDAHTWGDLHYADAIAAELRLRGHRAVVQTIEEWDDPAALACDVGLHLRGIASAPPRPERVNVLWCISHPDQLTPEECAAYDLAFAASPRVAERMTAAGSPTGVLLQATDPAVFYPDPRPEHRRELVFVGNSRGVTRRILADLLPTTHDLAVWGGGWEGRIDPRLVVGPFLPNEEVRHAYSSAAIVLNDHWDDMRKQELVSNRIYDALACGACVVSDRVDGMAERFDGAVATYEGREQLSSLVERLLADPDERVGRGAAGRRAILAQHTFAHRVDDLLAAVQPLLATRGRRAA